MFQPQEMQKVPDHYCEICDEVIPWVKTRDFPLMNQNLWERQKCRCETEKALLDEAEKAEELERAKAAMYTRHLQTIRKNSGLEGALNNAAFDQIHPSTPSARQAKELCVEWTGLYLDALNNGTETPEWGIILVGVRYTNQNGQLFTGNGNGKSTMIAAACNQLLNVGVPILWYQDGSWQDELKREFDRPEEYHTVMRKCKQAPVLVLDDFGKSPIRAGDSGAWARRQIFDLVNHRSNMRLPTLITTNLDADGIADWVGSDFGDAVADRIEGMCRGVNIKAPSERRTGGLGNYAGSKA